MQKMGELLAAQVLKSAKQIKPVSPMRYPIQHTSEILKFAASARSAHCDAAAGGTHAREGLPGARIAA